MTNLPRTSEAPAGTTTVTTPDSGFGAPERQAEALMRVLPYVLLAASMVPYALTQHPSAAGLTITLGLAVLAAAWTGWMVTMHPGWAGRQVLMSVYYLGFLAFGAVLISRSPWFAFFCWIGYPHAFQLLAGPWRYIGLAGTAGLSAIAEAGGLHPLAPSLIPVYVAVAALNVGLVATFIRLGQKSEEQNNARKRMIAELAGANHRLEEMMAENTGLHAQLLIQAGEAGVAEERQRMAREIHDTLAQGLTGIITQLEAAEQTPEAGDRRRHFENARSLARDSLREARRSVHAMRPEALEDARLPDALAKEAARWSAVSGVAAEVATTGTVRPLHPESEVTLLRVAQEALANVAKHAGASRVGLTLSYMEDVVTLDVRDDGAGFRLAGGTANGSPAGGGTGSRGGFGLTAMRQRVNRVAGNLAIESEPGSGTAICASVPVIAAARAGDAAGLAGETPVPARRTAPAGEAAT